MTLKYTGGTLAVGESVTIKLGGGIAYTWDDTNYITGITVPDADANELKKLGNVAEVI